MGAKKRKIMVANKVTYVAICTKKMNGVTVTESIKPDAIVSTTHATDVSQPVSVYVNGRGYFNLYRTTQYVFKWTTLNQNDGSVNNFETESLDEFIEFIDSTVIPQ